MAKKIPAFSYTGAYRTQSDGRYWYILLLTSGTLTFQYAKSGVDVGCVGGGGSSACHLQTANTAGGSGGGGGYIATGTTAITAGQGYAVSIGNGGAVPAVWLAGNDGGATSAFGITAQGGKGADLVHFFNEDGLGAIVNSSRGIIAAYQQEKYARFGAENFADASRAAVLDMKEDIEQALANR